MLMPPIDVGAGLWTIRKMLPFLKVAIYTSTYAMAECAQARIGKSGQECSLRGGIRGRVREDGQGYGGGRPSWESKNKPSERGSSGVPLLTTRMTTGACTCT